MAQNEGSEGIMGTVRSYIPGMSSPSTEAHATSGSQQGILSYIPGFGGSSAGNEAGNNGKETAAQHAATDAGEVTSPNKSAATNASPGAAGHTGHSSEEHHKKTSDSTNNYSSSYQGAGIGSKYSSGRDVSDEAPGQAGKTSNVPKDSTAGATGHTGSGHNVGDKTGASPGKTYGSDATDSPTTETGKPAHSDYLAKANDHGHNQGSQGYTGQAQGGNDDGVRGAPIEGEGVKGYAVSAPVGSGDTNVRASSGAPSGQVSGAHMQYAPEDRDTRDHAGRGTVEHTQGQGDSSFANVKRNIPHGTEHVVTKSSQSHIEHTSTTQL